MDEEHRTINLIEEAFRELRSSPMNLHVHEEFLLACMRDASPIARDHVRLLFVDDYDGDTFKWEFKEPAGMALLAWGDDGIEDIRRAFFDNEVMPIGRLLSTSFLLQLPEKAPCEYLWERLQRSGHSLQKAAICLHQFKWPQEKRWLNWFYQSTQLRMLQA